MSSNYRRIICGIPYLTILLIGGGLAPSLLAQSGGQAAIILRVTGLRSEKGQVKVGVFNSSAKWLGEQPIYSSTIRVDGQTVTWRINDVPNGDYGIAVFHDENSNGKMDKNVLGMPLEPYGFSNNARVALGPPKWEKAKFAVNGSPVEVTIEVK